ncbi:hypothetical protein SM124_00735 [Bacillus sp. 31A1R]|uniref:Uncharacterized protein n=1 Tax=Robertmurraya mangrovi TaxID=3098077 RepID=A0ABU5ISZ6_9BACI|nr:hypothetical protein [Bacillus sp. 31A1R]MDZ5470261.1 hypothetical protein [Bacillus sp. 31A1R]
MLTFEQKLAIIESFPQLQRKDVSLGRINFHYEESVTEKKNVVYHLHPNGNGFVYAEYLEEYEPDAKGFVNIRDFSEKELRSIIEKSIESLSPRPAAEEAIIGDADEERWVNEENQTLILISEEDTWNIYSGLNLENVFSSYMEALQYLEEEGFTRK